MWFSRIDNLSVFFQEINAKEEKSKTASERPAKKLATVKDNLVKANKKTNSTSESKSTGLLITQSFNQFEKLKIPINILYGTEAEIQLPLKRSSRFQRLFPNPSWLV